MDSDNEISSSPAEVERPGRRAVIGAAVLGGIVAISAGFALTRVDDGPGAAEQSEVIERLFELGPESISEHFVIEWRDVVAARQEAGLEPLPPQPSQDELIEHFTTLGEETGVVAGNAWRQGSRGADPMAWWGNTGIELGQIDGWMSWGAPPDSRSVMFGRFAPEAIDAAVRSNEGADQLVVGEHRGVTTYSWRDDFEMDVQRRDVFPGMFALRIAVVDDDIVVFATSTDSLQAIIDRHLDDGRSFAENHDARRILEAIGGGSPLGGQMVMMTDGWMATGMSGSRAAGSYTFAVLVQPDESAADHASRINACVDDLATEQPDLFGTMTLSVDADGGVVVLEARSNDGTELSPESGPGSHLDEIFASCVAGPQDGSGQ